MASSIRSFYQVCCRSYYLRVSTFFQSFVSVFAVLRAPIFLLSSSLHLILCPPLILSRGIVLSYTLKNRTHFSSTLIEFLPPFLKPKLLTSPSQFLCIQLIFSPDLLVEFLVFCQQEQATFVLLTKRHESFRDGKWKKNNETEEAEASPFFPSFSQTSIDFRGSLLRLEKSQRITIGAAPLPPCKTRDKVLSTCNSISLQFEQLSMDNVYTFART